jgi:putative PIN family toxin of toxin-antitoxin system
MKIRIFLDTNVFIYAFEFPQSNSRKIIELLNQAEIEAVISERVLREVQKYFLKYYNKDLSAAFRNYLLLSCTIIPSFLVHEEMNRYREMIKEKDLEQIAVVKMLGIKYLISYDRDFKPFEEYRTPKEFIKALNLEVTENEY